MVENTSSANSIEINISNNSKENEIINQISNFELQLNDASKQANSIECFETLKKARLYLKDYIEEKKKNKSEYLISQNLIYKLNKISQKNTLLIDLEITKIITDFLSPVNFDRLSNDSRILITLCNLALRNSDVLSITTEGNHYQKILTFLLFLLSKNSTSGTLSNSLNLNFDDEQVYIINELITQMKALKEGNNLASFKENFEKEILIPCQSDNLSDKEQGIAVLLEYFYNMSSLSEQFDGILECGHSLINAIIGHPNPYNVDAYCNLADFMVSYLYNTSYILEIGMDTTNITTYVKHNPHNFYLIDEVPNSITEYDSLKIPNYFNYQIGEHFSFLQGKFYELDYQKTLLLSAKNIVTLYIKLISALSIYGNIIKIQYICYILLRRLYFLFKESRSKFEDLLVNVLINMISYKKLPPDSLKEYTDFIQFLLKKGEESLQEKLKTKMNSLKIVLNEENQNDKNYDELTISSEVISLSEFNLRLGCPLIETVNAGAVSEKLIEVSYPNSLVSIYMSTVYYDISVHLLKYCPLLADEDKFYNEEQNFFEIFKLDKIKCNPLPLNIILYVKSPGIYKIVFDNSYSWFNSKTFRYRVSVLKPKDDKSQS